MLPPLPGCEPLPEETFEPPDEADELLGVGLASVLDDEGPDDDALDDGLAELPVPVGLVELPVPDPALRWACAACSANRPRLAAPAVTTTATAHRARPRIVFMASTLTARASVFLRVDLAPSVKAGSAG